MYLLPKLIFLIQKKKEVNFAEKIISNLPTTKKTISKCTKWYMPYLECCTMNFPHPCWVIGITTTSAICSKVIRSDTILVLGNLLTQLVLYIIPNHFWVTLRDQMRCQRLLKQPNFSRGIPPISNSIWRAGYSEHCQNIKLTYKI